jgi:triosephosphate isomerase
VEPSQEKYLLICYKTLVNIVILGHSERRAIFNETDALIASKVNTALEHDMTVIFVLVKN